MTAQLSWLSGALAALGLAGCASQPDARAGLGPDGRFAMVDGVRLHHHITGPEDAPAVLVLHGASANLHEPKFALADVLSEYRVIWLDRPGLGWSERPGGDWSPAREAALIAAFLDEIEVERASVIGHSWGAAITLRLMMDHPERTQGAVLVAPALRAWVGEAAFYNKATHWPVVGALITRAIVPTLGRGQLESGAASAFAPETMPDNYVAATRLPLLLRAPVWRANAADMAQVNHSLAAQEDRYGEIAQPVILIAGPGDTVVRTDRHAVPVAETLPNGELRLIEGAGHNPHHAHDQAVADALADVLARIDQSTRR